MEHKNDYSRLHDLCMHYSRHSDTYRITDGDDLVNLTPATTDRRRAQWWYEILSDASINNLLDCAALQGNPVRLTASNH